MERVLNTEGSTKTRTPDVPEWKFRRDLWRKSKPTTGASGVLDSENEDYIAAVLQDPS